MEYKFAEPGLPKKIRDIYSKITGEPKKNSDKEEMQEIIYDARKRWNTAEQAFNNVADPELVDWAIYDMMAAKARYSYLMKKAKDMEKTY